MKKIAEQTFKKSDITIKTPTHPIFSKICIFFQCPATTHPIFSKICIFFQYLVTTHPHYLNTQTFFFIESDISPYPIHSHVVYTSPYLQ